MMFYVVTNLYTRKIYTHKNPRGVIFFACPFGARRWIVAWAIKKIQRAGFTVVVYDFDNKILSGSDLTLLPKTIYQVSRDIRKLIKQYTSKGETNFGSFGTSLGSFVLFSAVAGNPEISWGIFNTAGNAAQGAWNIKLVRKNLAKHGHTLSDLFSAWSNAQNPEFVTRQTKGHFLFIGSNNDEVVPLAELGQYLDGMTSSGINIEIREYSRGRHITTALRGLYYSNRLVIEMESMH